MVSLRRSGIQLAGMPIENQLPRYHDFNDHLKVAQEQLPLSITYVWRDQTVVGGLALPRTKNDSRVHGERAKVIVEIRQLLP
jgi:hypothetical protein